MNKSTLLIIGVVVILILAALLFIPSGEEDAPTVTPPSPSPSTQISPPPSTVEAEIEITAEGFSPPTLTIPAGTTVRFTNKDAELHWPASGIHPTHQLCPGFDALKGLRPGESYSFTFTQAKTCPLHDHLNPQVRGSIFVQ